jgi:hypothetical protein
LPAPFLFIGRVVASAKLPVSGRTANPLEG